MERWVKGTLSEQEEAEFPANAGQTQSSAAQTSASCPQLIRHNQIRAPGQEIKNNYTEVWSCAVRLELVLSTLRAALALRDTSQFWQRFSWQQLQHKWPFHSASAMSFSSAPLGKQKRAKNHSFSMSIRSVRRWPRSHHLWQQLCEIEPILQARHCKYLSLTFILPWMETHLKAAKCV